MSKQPAGSLSGEPAGCFLLFAPKEESLVAFLAQPCYIESQHGSHPRKIEHGPYDCRRYETRRRSFLLGLPSRTGCRRTSLLRGRHGCSPVVLRAATNFSRSGIVGKSCKKVGTFGTLQRISEVSGFFPKAPDRRLQKIHKIPKTFGFFMWIL